MEDFTMSRGYIYNLVDDTIEYANFINDDTFLSNSLPVTLSHGREKAI